MNHAPTNTIRVLYLSYEELQLYSSSSSSSIGHDSSGNNISSNSNNSGSNSDIASTANALKMIYGNDFLNFSSASLPMQYINSVLDYDGVSSSSSSRGSSSCSSSTNTNTNTNSKWRKRSSEDLSISMDYYSHIHSKLSQPGSHSCRRYFDQLRSISPVVEEIEVGVEEGLGLEVGLGNGNSNSNSNSYNYNYNNGKEKQRDRQRDRQRKRLISTQFVTFDDCQADVWTCS